MKNKEFIEDDVKDSLEHLVSHRLPWLVIGLLGGILVTFIVSKYEKVLSGDIRLAFFIPIIVYMSDAIGTQTETIYIRNMKNKEYNFMAYFFKEILLGFCLCIIFGLILGIIAYYWLGSFEVALAVAIAMFINVTIAPALALIVPTILRKEHKDPALGTSPLTTIIQDLVSTMIYLGIASMIIFN